MLYEQGTDKGAASQGLGVLILVILEDALRGFAKEREVSTKKGLNPCYTGRCSTRMNLLGLYLNSL